MCNIRYEDDIKWCSIGYDMKIYLEREKGGRETGKGFVPPYRVGVSFCGWLWNSATEKHRDAHTKDQNTPGPHPHTHLQQALMSRHKNTFQECWEQTDVHARARWYSDDAAIKFTEEPVDEKQTAWENFRNKLSGLNIFKLYRCAVLIITKSQNGCLWFISALFSISDFNVI